MDKIWIETLARLDALEERVGFLETVCDRVQRPEPKPESQKDTVDLPKSEPEQK